MQEMSPWYKTECHTMIYVNACADDGLKCNDVKLVEYHTMTV